jgi:hypothetical protein
MSADAGIYVQRMRALSQARQEPTSDWRLSVLPAAIAAGLGPRTLAVAAAICTRQRGRYSVVIVGVDVIAKELKMDPANVFRSLRYLTRAQVFARQSGGGKMPGKKVGRANVYMLGPAALRVSRTTGKTVSPMTPYAVVAQSLDPVIDDTPTLRGTSYPSGGSGERTAALTGGSSPSQPSSQTIAPHRFRDLLGVLNPRKRSSPNAL